MKINKDDLNKELLRAIQDVKEGIVDHNAPLPATLVVLPYPIAKLRAHLGLSQASFAALMGISKRTIQEWEQGRHKPSGPARALLRVAYAHVDVFVNKRARLRKSAL
jgi:putative transcriptional regulator